MSAPTIFRTHDSKGRNRVIFICDKAHHHRSHRQAVKCNVEGRK